MKSFFKFSPFEIIIMILGAVSAGICGLLILSGTTFFSLPNFNETIAPPVFEAQYVTPGVEPVSTPSIAEAPTQAPGTVAPTPAPVAKSDEPASDADLPEKTAAAPTVTPFPTLGPTQYERIFLLFPQSQALLTHTRIDENKGYSLKLKFEVDPQNTPCRIEVKMGEEVVMSKELEGSPTGLYELSLLIKKPALYKWQVFTQHSKSEVRLFTIRK